MTYEPFHLLSSLGFDVDMVHVSVSTSMVFHKGHVMLVVNDVEQEGDGFLFDTAGGCPQPRTISLDFEKESPIYIDAYLEYKFIKMDDGKLLRMHRKGDGYAARGRQENSDIEFWIDDWRRFYTADLTVTTKDPSTFDEYYQDVYVNPKASPFHLSHRLVHFPGGKAAMVINDKTMIQNEDGELVTTVLEGGDEEIKAAINQICPSIPDQLIALSLLHWRQTLGPKDADYLTLISA